jgi:hypothetical protein
MPRPSVTWGADLWVPERGQSSHATASVLPLARVARRACEWGRPGRASDAPRSTASSPAAGRSRPRNSYASLLIQQGESLAYVKEQLGHHSIKITVDTYGHLVPGGNRQAVDRLDDTPLNATIRNPDATSPKLPMAAVSEVVEQSRLS